MLLTVLGAVDTSINDRQNPWPVELTFYKGQKDNKHNKKQNDASKISATGKIRTGRWDCKAVCVDCYFNAMKTYLSKDLLRCDGHFYMSTWLGYSTQLFNQTLI